MKVILTRHGATAGNLNKRYIGGATDEPLAFEGIQEILLKPVNGAVQRVYTSGMQRTVQTAGVLYPNALLATVPELCEMYFGDFEGKDWKELSGDPRYRRWVDGGCLEACPGGESRQQFVRRICTAFQSIMRAEEKSETQEAVFVVHGGTIMSLLSELGEPPLEYFSIQTPPGESWICIWEKQRLRVWEKPGGVLG